MNLKAITDNIVHLCKECNVWSSTITIPQCNGRFLDISSAARGDQSSTPDGATMHPKQCPKGMHGSYYMYDSLVYNKHSWPALKSMMLMKVGCVGGCKLVLWSPKVQVVVARQRIICGVPTVCWCRINPKVFMMVIMLASLMWRRSISSNPSIATSGWKAHDPCYWSRNNLRWKRRNWSITSFISGNQFIDVQSVAEQLMSISHAQWRFVSSCHPTIDGISTWTAILNTGFMQNLRI